MYKIKGSSDWRFSTFKAWRYPHSVCSHLPVLPMANHGFLAPCLSHLSSYSLLVLILFLDSTLAVLTCFPQGNNHISLVPSVSDCNYILARLPSIAASNHAIPGPSVDRYLSGPFLPPAVFRHGYCVVSLSTPFHALAFPESDILSMWTALLAGAERVIRECVKNRQGGIDRSYLNNSMTPSLQYSINIKASLTLFEMKQLQRQRASLQEGVQQWQLDPPPPGFIYEYFDV